MKRNNLLGIIIGLLFSNTTLSACIANVEIVKPDSIYTDHNNGTVTDIQTGLMWQKCTLGFSGNACETTGTLAEFSWKSATEAVQNANIGEGMLGYSDWRLPSLAELRSLVETACSWPAINSTLFPAMLMSM